MRRRILSNMYIKEIDMGDDIIWADRNIGSESPEDFGLYFQWAGIVGQTLDRALNDPYLYYDMIDYPYYDKEYEGDKINDYWLKYKGANVNDIVLHPEDDAAHIILGNGWRIPTENEYKKLINSCVHEIFSVESGTTDNGLPIAPDATGIIFKNNGNELYFPAADIIATVENVHNNTRYNVWGNDRGRASGGGYWCSNCGQFNSVGRFTFNYREATAQCAFHTRVGGLPIRPVKDKY